MLTHENCLNNIGVHNHESIYSASSCGSLDISLSPSTIDLRETRLECSYVDVPVAVKVKKAHIIFFFKIYVHMRVVFQMDDGDINNLRYRSKKRRYDQLLYTTSATPIFQRSICVETISFVWNQLLCPSCFLFVCVRERERDAWRNVNLCKFRPVKYVLTTHDTLMAKQIKQQGNKPLPNITNSTSNSNGNKPFLCWIRHRTGWSHGHSRSKMYWFKIMRAKMPCIYNGRCISSFPGKNLRFCFNQIDCDSTDHEFQGCHTLKTNNCLSFSVASNMFRQLWMTIWISVIWFSHSSVNEDMRKRAISEFQTHYVKQHSAQRAPTLSISKWCSSFGWSGKNKNWFFVSFVGWIFIQIERTWLQSDRHPYTHKQTYTYARTVLEVGWCK